MDSTYKNLIFTKHALNRMSERSISQHAVWQVLNQPDISRPEGKPNTTRFIRLLNDRKYHVVATYLPDQKRTLVVSTWVRGEEDAVPIVWQLLVLPFKLIAKVAKWALFRRNKHSRK